MTEKTLGWKCLLCGSMNYEVDADDCYVCKRLNKGLYQNTMVGIQHQKEEAKKLHDTATLLTRGLPTVNPADNPLNQEWHDQKVLDNAEANRKDRI